MQEKHSTLDNILDQRKEKIAKIREMGIDPFPYSYKVTHKSKTILDNFDQLEEKEVSVAFNEYPPHG